MYFKYAINYFGKCSCFVMDIGLRITSCSDPASTGVNITMSVDIISFERSNHSCKVLGFM